METTINFRISYEQKDHLQNLAEERGVKISVIAREIIIDYLDNLDTDEDDYGFDSKNSREIYIHLPDIEEIMLDI